MKELQRLIQIVKQLRAPEGCPWDREQTFSSLTPYIIEEAYELVDAMEKGPGPDLKEELGDVLLHVIMLSNMAEELNQFSVEDVAKDEADKMIRRHPHVFGDAKADSVDEVWSNWDQIKATEKENQGPLDSVPRQLPGLMQAQKLQKKAAKFGFDWSSHEGALEKITEEVQELADALDAKPQDKDACQEEFGDLLFSVVNVGRKLGLNAEEALRHCNNKFRDRIDCMHNQTTSRGQRLDELSLDELEGLWNEAKTAE